MSKRAILLSVVMVALGSMAAGGLAAQAAAPPPQMAIPPGRADLVTKPVLAKILSNASLTLFYPELARTMGVTGYAIVGCEVSSEGALANCALITQDPKGRGFGFSLLKVAGHLRIGPADEAGQPTVGRPIHLAAQFGAVKGQRDADGAQVYGLNLYVVGE